MTGITDAGNNTNWQFTEPTTVTPTVTTQTSSSGGSAQSRVNNLLAMGNTTLANQIAQQYNIAIPNTKTTPNTSIFMRSLQLGMTGNDVKQLQIFLNSKGYTVSYTGPGSPGNETTTFGTKTKLALIKYQKANNITPAIGYFGQVTRAQLSK
jgi:peptidoglycan hydrolase-like protein with peptidoglycan-binding domain